MSPLSPQQKYAEAKSQYEAVAAAAKAGDEKAQGRYQDVYTAFLEASRTIFASSAGYRQDFDYAQAMTAEVAKWTEDQVTSGQAQLDVLKLQVSGIIEVNKSVLSVRDALQQYYAAQTAATAPLSVPVVAPIPYYQSEGRTNNAAIEAGLSVLNNQLTGLRSDLQQQTGDQIAAQVETALESATVISKALANATLVWGGNQRVLPE